MDEHLAHKYGMSTEEAKQRNAQVLASIRALGLPADFDTIRRTNTQPAHRLLQFAKTKGLGTPLYDLVQRAYYAEGKLISSTETLLALAEEAGIEREEAQAALEDERYAEALQFDVQEARQLGISGVPFFVFDRSMAVSGAHPAETLLGALHKATENAKD